MKVRYLLDGVEKEGDAKDLSTLGAFIQTDTPARDGPVNLLLQLQGNSISIPGQVVDILDHGFSVAFDVLELSTLDHLAAALGMDQDQKNKSPLSDLDLMESQDELIDIEGQRWTPPVTEPRVHEWKPSSDLLTPPPDGLKKQDSPRLPTLSPASHAGPLLNSENNTPQVQTQPAPSTPAAKPADKRLATRHEMSIPVAFDNLTGLIKEFTHNISYGGMFVYTTEPIKENSEIAVTLVHPVHGQRLTLLAKVVHASDAPNPDPVSGQPRYGLGIEFRLPLDELKRVLSDFIGSHQNHGADLQLAKIMAEARSRLELAAQSPYSLLGLDAGSDQNQIRQAYFKLVDRFHPDRYFGKVTDKDRKILEELFRSLTKAYEELTA